MIDDAQFASLLISAFILGVLGTGHCASMCGGFVSAFVLGNKGQIAPVRRTPMHWLLSYNLGRIISYSVAGAIAGGLSSSALHLFEVDTARTLAHMLAAFSLIAVGLYLSGWPQLLAPVEKAGHRVWKFLSPLASRFLRVESSFTALRLGMLWGWLPCGLVYSVALTALTTGDPLKGAQVMVFFGMGTLPSMMAIGVAAAGMKRFSTNNIVRRSCGVVVSGFGVYALLSMQHV